MRAFIRQTDPSSQLASVELRNDGHAPDISSSDSVYTGVATMQLQRTLVGDLTVHVIAVSPLGDESVELIEPMKIVRLNRPPVLSELTAPSVVDPATEPTFLITVRVTDPDGASDVRIVYRQTPSLKIFPLNDLQQNGDRVAGDGIYTETVSVQPPPIPGIYLFQFRAVDRSGDSSNVLYHTIEIK
jgi:hypothetical protein